MWNLLLQLFDLHVSDLELLILLTHARFQQSHIVLHDSECLDLILVLRPIAIVLLIVVFFQRSDLLRQPVHFVLNNSHLLFFHSL